MKISTGYRPNDFQGPDGYFPRVGSDSQAGGIDQGQHILPSVPATSFYNQFNWIFWKACSKVFALLTISLIEKNLGYFMYSQFISFNTFYAY